MAKYRHSRANHYSDSDDDDDERYTFVLPYVRPNYADFFDFWKPSENDAVLPPPSSSQDGRCLLEPLDARQAVRGLLDGTLVDARTVKFDAPRDGHQQGQARDASVQRPIRIYLERKDSPSSASDLSAPPSCPSTTTAPPQFRTTYPSTRNLYTSSSSSRLALPKRPWDVFLCPPLPQALRTSSSSSSAVWHSPGPKTFNFIEIFTTASTSPLSRPPIPPRCVRFQLPFATGGKRDFNAARQGDLVGLYGSLRAQCLVFLKRHHGPLLARFLSSSSTTTTTSTATTTESQDDDAGDEVLARRVVPDLVLIVRPVMEILEQETLVDFHLRSAAAVTTVHGSESDTVVGGDDDEDDDKSRVFDTHRDPTPESARIRDKGEAESGRVAKDEHGDEGIDSEIRALRADVMRTVASAVAHHVMFSFRGRKLLYVGQNLPSAQSHHSSAPPSSFRDA